MDAWLIAGSSVAFVVLVAFYVREWRLRPDAGGTTLRWALRWALLFVGAVLLMTIAQDTPFTWLRVVTLLALLTVSGMILRDIGLSATDRRGRGRYRPVRGGGTGVDGYRGD